MKISFFIIRILLKVQLTKLLNPFYSLGKATHKITLIVSNEKSSCAEFSGTYSGLLQPVCVCVSLAAKPRSHGDGITFT